MERRGAGGAAGASAGHLKGGSALMRDIIKRMEALILQYETLKVEICKLAPDGRKLIRIIEAETENPERRIAFLESAKEELQKGGIPDVCLYDDKQ